MKHEKLNKFYSYTFDSIDKNSFFDNETSQCTTGISLFIMAAFKADSPCVLQNSISPSLKFHRKYLGKNMFNNLNNYTCFQYLPQSIPLVVFRRNRIQ